MKGVSLDEFTQEKGCTGIFCRALLNAPSRITPSKTVPEKKSRHTEVMELFPLISICQHSLVAKPTFLNQFYSSVSGHSAQRHEEQQLQFLHFVFSLN